MILKARRVQGLKTNLSTNTKYPLVVQKGPGVFVACHVTKQGGSNDISAVSLFIDGANVVSVTYAAAGNFGLGSVNNSGIQFVKGPVDCLSIQYNEPLFFEKECRIELSTGSDAGVVQVIANAVLGSTCSYPN